MSAGPGGGPSCGPPGNAGSVGAGPRGREGGGQPAGPRGWSRRTGALGASAGVCTWGSAVLCCVVLPCTALCCAVLYRVLSAPRGLHGLLSPEGSVLVRAAAVLCMELHSGPAGNPGASPLLSEDFATLKGSLW